MPYKFNIFTGNLDYYEAAGASVVSDIVYGATWNGVTTIAPSKNATYDKMETIGRRVSTEASSATPTINTDTADAHAITSFTTNLSGTPTNFQKLLIRIKDNATARAITWGASFLDKGVALPTTTVISKCLTVGFIYDSVAAVWGCVAVGNET